MEKLGKDLAEFVKNLLGNFFGRSARRIEPGNLFRLQQVSNFIGMFIIFAYFFEKIFFFLLETV